MVGGAVVGGTVVGGSVVVVVVVDGVVVDVVLVVGASVVDGSVVGGVLVSPVGPLSLAAGEAARSVPPPSRSSRNAPPAERSSPTPSPIRSMVTRAAGGARRRPREREVRRRDGEPEPMSRREAVRALALATGDSTVVNVVDVSIMRRIISRRRLSATA